MERSETTKNVGMHRGTITQVQHQYGDYYTVRIQPDEALTWTAGEHAIFTLPDATFEGRAWRAFSLASIPEEGYILLGFRTGETPSPFKRFIIEQGLNARIDIKGPQGAFKLKDNGKPVVLFASGVGITPIFSILKAAAHDHTREIFVVYAAAEFYLFGEQIDEIARENPHIHVFYTHAREETQQQLAALAKELGNNADYFNSGAGSVIESTRELLSEAGIDKSNMTDDFFVGYQS